MGPVFPIPTVSQTAMAERRRKDNPITDELRSIRELAQTNPSLRHTVHGVETTIVRLSGAGTTVTRVRADGRKFSGTQVPDKPSRIAEARVLITFSSVTAALDMARRRLRTTTPLMHIESSLKGVALPPAMHGAEKMVISVVEHTVTVAIQRGAEKLIVVADDDGGLAETGWNALLPVPVVATQAQ